jgi:hypothetical protein
MGKIKHGHKSKGYKNQTKPARDEREGNLVLVGFGKHNLDEILNWVGTPREIEALKAPLLWPPRWRRESLCSEEDKTNFAEYTATMQNLNFTDYVNL